MSTPAIHFDADSISTLQKAARLAYSMSDATQETCLAFGLMLIAIIREQDPSSADQLSRALRLKKCDPTGSDYELIWVRRREWYEAKEQWEEGAKQLDLFNEVLAELKKMGLKEAILASAFLRLNRKPGAAA